jgi:hypothetical protein
MNLTEDGIRFQYGEYTAAPENRLQVFIALHPLSSAGHAPIENCLCGSAIAQHWNGRSFLAAPVSHHLLLIMVRLSSLSRTDADTAISGWDVAEFAVDPIAFAPLLAGWGFNR